MAVTWLRDHCVTAVFLLSYLLNKLTKNGIMTCVLG